MERKQRQLLSVVLGALCAIAVIIAIIYVRQRLFTRTEPIVLSA